MDTLLTLVIALGGIATGVGAIWAAMVARRQAQVTERSLAQTERNLAEQNERSRLNLEFDLLTRIQDRFDSPHFYGRRRSAAKDVIDNFFSDNGTVGVECFNRAAHDVANFFEGVGYLQRRGALEAESVWHTFGIMTQAYWTLYERAIRKIREEQKDPAVYEEFELLNQLMADLDGERGIEPPTQDQVRRIVQDEATIGEEPPTTK